MKAIIQRVNKASVSVDGNLISSIGKGLCILVGIARNDTEKDIQYIVKKILGLRIFNDESKSWNVSVQDKGYEILCVSQFTLHAILKGNRLDFHNAMSGDQAKIFYNQFLNNLQTKYQPDLIKDGVFGAYMQVSIENDGPVTIEIESPKTEKEN